MKYVGPPIKKRFRRAVLGNAGFSTRKKKDKPAYLLGVKGHVEGRGKRERGGCFTRKEKKKELSREGGKKGDFSRI